MNLMDNCKCGGKPLKSDKSIRAGYGSVCKRKQVAEADAE